MCLESGALASGDLRYDGGRRMPRDSLRCSRCQIPLDAGTERCPRCLRKSTVVDGEGTVVGRLDHHVPAEPAPPQSGPRFVGVRAAVLVAAYAVIGPLVYLILRDEAALKARDLWLPGGFASLMLGTLPLRMVFAPPEASSSAREAAREYALRMAAVVGFSAGMALAQALAVRLVGDAFLAIFLGLLLFLLPLFVGIPIAGALRKKISVREAITGAARQAGLTFLIVGMVGVLALRPRPQKQAIVLPPPDVKSLLDPMDLESVRAKATWEPDASGAPALYLRADAPEFDRTLQKLVVEAVIRVKDVELRPGASGTVIVVVPSRFETPENDRKAREEERSLNDTLTKVGKTTGQGKPIQVRFVFGR